MRFEWDEEKNRANVGKHGFSFVEAAEMFHGPFLVRPDTRNDYGEKRWIGIGMTKGRIAFVAFTEEPEDMIRIVSLRKATHEERKEYEKGLPNGLEAH